MQSNGRRLKQARLAKGMTQNDLAGKLGVVAATVSRWEADQIEIDPAWAAEISRHLGIDAATLIGLNEAKGQPPSPEQTAAMQLGWELLRLDEVPRVLAILVGRSLQSYAGRHELPRLLKDMASGKPVAIYRTRKPGSRAKKKGPPSSS